MLSWNSTYHTAIMHHIKQLVLRVLQSLSSEAIPPCFVNNVTNSMEVHQFHIVSSNIALLAKGATQMSSFCVLCANSTKRIEDYK